MYFFLPCVSKTPLSHWLLEHALECKVWVSACLHLKQQLLNHPTLLCMPAASHPSAEQSWNHLHMAEYDSSKLAERRQHVLAHEDVSVGISSTHPSAHQSQSAMLPNRMHHLEDKLTEPNPTNCLPHVAARTPASFKART
jgi:hypothetical protein